ncbi:MAG: HNH nuclease family protein [Nitrospinaceae bacterium]|jgi:predicted HNH restriction endonuclease|nr:HNH nuclease family protein [Nitrospinaceae bacterium]MBT3434124.1 HNH nuclease family protein [Nitrospinaceae bacterium]MBT3820237.1 HNH nuclease family protein [Nitrospinaceae bacterium]MBT4094554.1 HNH nuclease family protein [Nitrospinaceae bacterium]MBT4431476.1 HNH nuclease family protein [Nitrospinaceae bacterium]
MARTSFGPKRRPGVRPRTKQKTPEPSGESAKEIAARLKGAAAIGKNAAPYRRQSLDIHGWLCAKCGMDFNENNLHLLTVHHRDSNHKNNPPDGSNWENLCVHCHDDEHSRNMLGDYLGGGR